MSIKIKTSSGAWAQVDGAGTSAVTMQKVYDAIYPVGKTVIGFEAPTVPADVTAVWDDVSASYEGKALWISSSQTAGTELTGSLPKIEGYLGQDLFKGDSGFTANGVFTGSSWASCWEITNQGTGQPFMNTSITFKASNSNSVYSASAGTNVVRPTSVVCKIFRRSS